LLQGTLPYLLLIRSLWFIVFRVGAAEEAIPATGAVPGEVQTPDELAGLTPEQAEQLRAEWSRELARVEDEIATLRTVLQSKVKILIN
jgi:hypothetical protein